MRFAAVLAGKSVSVTSRLLRKGAGTTLPGIFAERLHPGLLRDLTREVGSRPIVVTGTNGKTTTAKMLGDAFESAGRTVVRNDSGSNLRHGIGSTLVAAAKLTGGMRGDIAVLEVDEAATATVVPDVEPDVIVVTNLSRDQMDRYGDLDALCDRLGRTLSQMPNTRVLLNADDPLTVGLGMQAAGPVSYFGIDTATCNEAAAAPSRAGAPCPSCATPVEIVHSFYGHLGDWRCPRCGEARPALDFAARDVHLEDASSFFALDDGTGERVVTVPVAGLHNLYNALAASAAASMAGAPLEATASAMARFVPAFGRTECMQVDGSSVILLLAKNPAGAEQALATALQSDDGGPVALVLNDNAADGTDVSWIWDVDFEGLEFGDRQLVVGGSRAEDLAVRLKYALLRKTPALKENDPAEAVRLLARLTPPHGTSHVVATYTAMLAIRNAFAHNGDRFSSLGVRLGHNG